MMTIEWFCHYNGWGDYQAQYVRYMSGNQICFWMVPNTQTNDWDA